MNDWVITLAPLIGLSANVLVQIVVAQAVRRVAASIVAGALAGFVVTLAVAVGGSVQTPLSARAGNVVLSGLSNLGFAFGFWTFLNLNITSLRIRMLREALRAPAGLARGELLAEYSGEEFLRRRLDRLEASRQLRHVDGRWYLAGNSYLWLARALQIARAIIIPVQRK